MNASDGAANDNFGGAVDDTECPVNGCVARDFPEAARGFVFSGKIFGEESRFFDAFVHLVAITPGLQREETGHFPEGIANYRVGTYAEAENEIADGGAERDLSEEGGFMIFV